MSSGNERITAKGFPSHIDSTVLIIGKLDRQDNSEATFILNDGTVTVHAGDAIEPLELGGVYQIFGKVIDDTALKAYLVTKLPTEELPPAAFEERVISLREGPAKANIFVPPSESGAAFS